MGKAMRWDQHLSREAHDRTDSSLKVAEQLRGNKDLIYLGSGQPTIDCFPVSGIDFTWKSSHEAQSTARDADQDGQLGCSDYSLDRALQYDQGIGAPPLLGWVNEHVKSVHNPPYLDWSCAMTVGSTSAIEMGLRMFCERGDWILTEEYTFPSLLETAKALGVQVAAVSMDEEGMSAESLDLILTRWERDPTDKRRPSFLYTVPTGQNPSGATQSIQRRRDIYSVAQKHNLFIMEDDPYYFLQMEKFSIDNNSESLLTNGHGAQNPPQLVRSYLSIDSDGRVMRLDSFSKVVVPGARVGWITACHQICDCYRKHANLLTQGPSGISQYLLYKLLQDHWGQAHFLGKAREVCKVYEQRRNEMLSACHLYLPTTVASWVPPVAGLFVWIEVDIQHHPDNEKLSRLEIEQLILDCILRHGTFVMPGSKFRANDSVVSPRLYYRAAYSSVDTAMMWEGMKQMGAALRESFAL